MIIAQPSRPKTKRQRKNSPHVVQTTTPSMTVTPVDTQVLYPSDQVLPAFYVSPTGSDNNPGTEAEPFATIEMARDSMRSSGTISRTYLRGGTYNVTSALLLNSNDASTEWLAYPTETPVIDAGNNATPIFSIAVNTNGITFKELTVQNIGGTSNANAAFYFSGSPNNVTIEGCTGTNLPVFIWQNATGGDTWKILGNNISNIQNSGIYLRYTPDNVTVAGNYIVDTGLNTSNTVNAHGMNFSRGSDGLTIEYNTTLRSINRGISLTDTDRGGHINALIRRNIVKQHSSVVDDAGGIYTLGRVWETRVYTDSIIEENWVEDSDNTSANLNIGIYLDDGSSGLTVRNNILIRNHNYAIHLHGGQDNTISNNITLLQEGTPVGAGAGRQDELFIDYVTASTFKDPDTMTGNVIQRNIMIPVNSSLTRISYSATTASVTWFGEGGGPTVYPTTQDNALGTDIAIEGSPVNESSSSQFDSTTNEATGTDGGYFDDYDPSNFILELHSSHPAYTEGFTDITGVTDGGTFNWGDPVQNSNSGYVRSNY